MKYFPCCCCNMRPGIAVNTWIKPLLTIVLAGGPFIPHHSLLWTLNSEYYTCLTSKDCNTLFRTAGEDHCQKAFCSSNTGNNWQFCMGGFDYPSYSPNLPPSDYLFSPKFKEFLGRVCFDSDKELKKQVVKKHSGKFLRQGNYIACLPIW